MPRKKDWAMIAAENIWDDCLDRAGLKFEFRHVSSRIKWDDVLPAWARLIRQAEGAKPTVREAIPAALDATKQEGS